MIHAYPMAAHSSHTHDCSLEMGIPSAYSKEWCKTPPFHKHFERQMEGDSRHTFWSLDYVKHPSLYYFLPFDCTFVLPEEKKKKQLEIKP